MHIVVPMFVYMLMKIFVIRVRVSNGIFSNADSKNVHLVKKMLKCMNSSAMMVEKMSRFHVTYWGGKYGNFKLTSGKNECPALLLRTHVQTRHK